MTPPKGQSIGVFDSGFGGLTVLKALITALPEESYIYLGDSARLPYGTKSRATIKKYLEQNIAVLKDHGVKALVVACNSASSVLSPNDDYGLPVYSVITPGAQRAQAVSAGRIGVIGTRATVSSGVYTHALKELDPALEVFSTPCPLLVPLVEEGLENDPLTNLITYRYVHPLLQHGIDTLILGCTHYPVLTRALRKVVGPHIELVDSAAAMAEVIQQDIKNGRIPRASSDRPELRLLASDVGSSCTEVARRVLAPLPFERLEPIDL